MFRPQRVIGVLACVAALVLAARAQAQPPVAKPQPPPAAGQAPPQPASQAKPAAPATTVPAQASNPASEPKPQPLGAATGEAAPTDAQLGGIRVYPGARFIGSYDAGLGQRFYLFGTLQPFSEMVAFYRSELKQKGELVFDAPPTHMFDVGKFREDAMAFPPGVTIKDYTWGGSPGYLNPAPGTTPAAFPTIIQIVPPPGLPAGPIR
jgi:hypothetical protein